MTTFPFGYRDRTFFRNCHWDKFQDDLLWKALKMVDLYDFVSSLEDGLDTIVGTGGLNFSGGQKQRIAIARAFVKNSPIMIFDESTSALDSESEMTIKKSWELLGKNHTLLIIAHRLSTIINSDRIIVFEDGKVAGFGKQEELFVCFFVTDITDQVDQDIVQYFIY